KRDQKVRKPNIRTFRLFDFLTLRLLQRLTPGQSPGNTKQLCKQGDRMRKALPLAAALMLLAGIGSRARAQEAVKIGYVDVQRAINETIEGQSAKKKLKGIFDQKQKELDEKQNELKKMKEDLDKQRTILKADTISARE